jgi:hypothetical protein
MFVFLYEFAICVHVGFPESIWDLLSCKTTLAVMLSVKGRISLSEPCLLISCSAAT